MSILFLDYDGVLHPDEVYMSKRNGIVLRADGHNLFEYAELLADALEQHQDVRIVLSTSWVSVLDFDIAKARLPERLQLRVIGSTCHSTYNKYEWNTLTRYRQIMRYVLRHNLKSWLALDNDDKGWPDDKRHRLIHTDDWGGLGGTVGALDDLQTKLESREVD